MAEKPLRICIKCKHLLAPLTCHEIARCATGPYIYGVTGESKLWLCEVKNMTAHCPDYEEVRNATG